MNFMYFWEAFWCINKRGRNYLGNIQSWFMNFQSILNNTTLHQCKYIWWCVLSLQIYFFIVRVPVIYYNSEIPCFKSTICCTDEFGVNYTIASLSIPTVSSFIKSIFFHGHTYSILNVTECTYHEWRNYFTASTTFPFLHQRNLEFSDLRTQ